MSLTNNFVSTPTTLVLYFSLPSFLLSLYLSLFACLLPFSVSSALVAVVNVAEVLPVARVTSTPKLMSGKKNRMLLNVSVNFHETDLTTGVQGEDLWNMTIWTSRNPNGEGFAYSVAKNVLTAEQRSQRHRKGKKFPKLRNIPYNLDARRMSCDEMRFICVRFEQATNPGHANRAYVPFYFTGYPDDNVLTGCTPAPRCKRKQC